MDHISVLIVDDHTLFREGVQAILKGVSGVEVIGEAASGREAIEQSELLSPDVILMDIQMPDMNGIQATEAILSKNPEAGVIMVSMLEDGDFLFAAMRAGARGYVLKGAGKEEMLVSIRAVADGQAIFGPAVANRLSAYFREVNITTRRESSKKAFPELTDREYEILDHIARGQNNQEIANQLHITPKTVSNHISNIFNKLQVVDRAQAIVKARDAGM